MINTSNAPAAIGPYAQAVKSQGFVFISGQIPIDPKTNTVSLFEGDIKQQTALVLANIDAILTAAGCIKTDVVKTTILLMNMADFDTVNSVYAQYFGDHKPARSTYAVAGLPKGVSIEIETIAKCKTEGPHRG